MGACVFKTINVNKGIKGNYYLTESNGFVLAVENQCNETNTIVCSFANGNTYPFFLKELKRIKL